MSRVVLSAVAPENSGPGAGDARVAQLAARRINLRRYRGQPEVRKAVRELRAAADRVVELTNDKPERR